MAAVANPEEVDKDFLKAVRKSSKEADAMEHKDKIEDPSILNAVKDKVVEGVHKVAEVAHKIVGHDPPKEGQINKKEPPIGDQSQDAAEYYAEHASQKFDSEKSSLSSQKGSTD